MFVFCVSICFSLIYLFMPVLSCLLYCICFSFILIFLPAAFLLIFICLLSCICFFPFILICVLSVRAFLLILLLPAAFLLFACFPASERIFFDALFIQQGIYLHFIYNALGIHSRMSHINPTDLFHKSAFQAQLICNGIHTSPC